MTTWPSGDSEGMKGRMMIELTNLIEAVRKYRALRGAHVARWGEDNDWMLRSRPTPKDCDEYNAGNSALVAAHKEVFRAALALGDVEQVETGGDGRTGSGGGPAQR